jgi:hypothetical protein
LFYLIRHPLMIAPIAARRQALLAERLLWSCQSRRWRRTIGKRRCENGIGPDGMWDEKDGFYYDILHLPDGNATRLKVRSAQ